MAAPRKTPAGSTPVEATIHHDKRTNIPTADAQEFVAPEATVPIALRYPRDPSLDPQLVWKGKDAQDDGDLEVVVPPIYIQEKIDPRVLVENLRKTAKVGQAEPELTLFDAFDGLGGLDNIEFYKHDANWSNRMVLGDSLQVMGSLAAREGLRGKVQMIYIDPPYGIKFGSNWQMSTRKRDVKDGKLEDATFEVEQIKAFRDTWELGIHSYLAYLRERLIVARDLLTESGSCFVQIGDENVHLVRSLMDEVFGKENFVVSVIVKKKGGTTPTDPVNDYLVWYGRDRSSLKLRPLYERRARPEDEPKFNTLIGPSGDMTRVAKLDPAEIARLESAGHRWARVNYPLVSQDSNERSRPYTMGGRTFLCGANKHWRYDPVLQMPRLEAAGRLFDGGGKSLGGVVYWDDWPYVSRSNLWEDLSGEQDPIYVVQTTTKILQRCLLMCTDPGDLVLDPTCGSGTTAYVAEQWGRRWITIDTSRVALALARQRVMGSRYPFYLLADSAEGREKEASLGGRPSAEEPIRGDIHRGFVYERVQRVTLTSIAHNPDMKEGMGRDEIDAAIKRHADFELLYDKPYGNNKKVRVAGPFTVESLSPHRSLAFAGQAPAKALERQSKGELAAEQESVGFEQMILDNLQRSPIQNGRKNERLTFASIEAYPGEFVQAVGESTDEQSVQRVGIAIGPQYGTVSSQFIKSAAREALKAEPQIELLAVLAFAFDPQTLGRESEYVSSVEGFADVAAERSLGRLPVLLVRMNNDLVMGEDLKKTGAGNLFTVFGQPDIDIRTDGDEATVEILGVDVYDPTTGQVRSNDTDHIALWMIDTNYNEESFFVRHCYFTGGNDPYARLKKALKADINEDAWATLNQTTSRPFPKPETGKIAVKVINDYGDEVMQVFEVK